MKLLQEIAVAADGKVLLKNGFYLEPEPPRPSKDHKTWTVRRLMNDDVVLANVDVDVVADGDSSDYMFYFETVTPSHLNQSYSVHFRAPSYKMMLDGFYAWVEKNLHRIDINEDLFADARKARQKKADDAKPVYLRRLNKDGSESGMRDALTFYDTEAEARAYHDRLVKNNPRQKIAHHLYSYNGEETFKAKLVNGKLMGLKGGIAGEPNIDDAVHAFIEMLDDEGSTAGMWMPWPKKVELYKLYKAKHKIKSTGVDIEDLDQAKADAKVKRKIDSLLMKGWMLFMKEETGNYVDMVFTKAS